MLKIGIDLGGTKIAVGLVDESDNILCKTWTPTRGGEGAGAIVSDMASCIANVLTLAGAEIGDCSGIGIGSPGTCDTERGIVTHAHNLGWDDVPLCGMLGEIIGVPVYLDNDANCAALGEVRAGAAKGCSSALMVTLGTGVGGGLIIDGQIFSGWRGLGGEIGHTCIAMGGEKCSCGESGCWEAYASATALIRQARLAADLNPHSALNTAPELNGKAIFDAMHAGDETAAAVVSKYYGYVGVGLVNIINFLYPEVIIIGGGISSQGESMLIPIENYIAEHFFVGRREYMPRLSIARLGNDAGIIGAAALCD